MSTQTLQPVVSRRSSLRFAIPGQDKIVLVFVVLYAFAQVVLAVRHEPWRDESQAWLIARDATPWRIVSDLTSQEGHPALWFFVLMPFAKLGVGYWSMEMLSVVITVLAAVLLIAVKAPTIWKIVVLFTPLFWYWPSVVSRSYCLIALFAMLAAVLYPRRNRHPWAYALVAALLFQTHALTFAFAGMLALFQMIELCRQRRFPFPTLLPATSVLAALGELMGGEQPVPMTGSVLDRLKMLTSPIAGSVGGGHQTLTFAVVTMLIAAVLVVTAVRSVTAALYGLAGVVWLAFMDVVVYPISNVQKLAAWLSMLLLVVPFSAADAGQRSNAKPNARHRNISIDGTNRMASRMLVGVSLILALLLTPSTMEASYKDLTGSFSAGPALGRLLNDHTTGGTVIVPIADRGSQYAVSNALPYLTRGQVMWSMAVNGEISYVTNQFRDYWNQHGSVSDKEAPEQAAMLVDEHIARNTQTIIVACADSGQTGLDNAFSQDRRMTLLGTVDEPDVNESLRSVHGGIRCSAYAYKRD
ncbi:hypothetical protein KIH79_12280 [Bifidobacterium sp. 82T10]|uniref:Uncharacterized protein n=1 Tax=Bifidobacterium miconis TaxID=2834435 RepID=A0ABS6WI24_9BIFI|nr:hypothetical protein [Bifidobacterium miconis]MBW3093678.1 hypothetical protein [Bifidobacterium miconis]